MTGTAAAMDAYNVKSPRVAQTIASENMSKPIIQDAIQEAFARAGITVDDIIAPIKDGLEATNIVANRDWYRQRPGETTEQYDKRMEQEVPYLEERPDHGTRLRASDLAAKFLGVGKTPKDDDPPGVTALTFIQNNNYLQGK